MNCSNNTGRRLILGIVVFAGFSWVSCSSGETREAYDKYYGKQREQRETEAITADSISRAEFAASRLIEMETSAAKEEKGPISLTPPAEIAELMAQNTCSVCHKPDERLVGPAFVEIAKRNYTPEQMVELVHNPKPENWPDYPPMAPLAHVAKEDILKIAGWINSLR